MEKGGMETRLYKKLMSRKVYYKQFEMFGFWNSYFLRGNPNWISQVEIEKVYLVRIGQDKSVKPIFLSF